MAHELGYDLDEAIKRQNISRENIVAIRESKLPYVPHNVTDKMVRFYLIFFFFFKRSFVNFDVYLFQIALFLDACDSLEETKSVMSIYYRTRQTSPEHFQNRDPRSDEIQQCLNNQ